MLESMSFRQKIMLVNIVYDNTYCFSDETETRLVSLALNSFRYISTEKNRFRPSSLFEHRTGSAPPVGK